MRLTVTQIDTGVRVVLGIGSPFAVSELAVEASARIAADEANAAAAAAAQATANAALLPVTNVAEPAEGETSSVLAIGANVVTAAMGNGPVQLPGKAGLCAIMNTLTGGLTVLAPSADGGQVNGAASIAIAPGQQTWFFSADGVIWHA